MLIVCYTNHALDQFLEGIVSFYKGSIVRVGGRSTNEVLERLTLKALKKADRGQTSPVTVMKRLREQAMEDVLKAANVLDKLAVKAEIYQTCLVHESHLHHTMSRALSQSLINGERNASILSIVSSWLQIQIIESEIRHELSNKKSILRDTNKFIDVGNDSREQLEKIVDFIREGEKGKLFQQLLESAKSQLTVDIYGHIMEKIDINEKRIIQLKCELRCLEGHTETKKNRKREIKLTIKHLKVQLRKLRAETEFETSVLTSMKQQIRLLIASRNIMAADEAESVVCVWELNREQRWRLYRFWIQNLLEGLCAEIEIRKPELEDLAVKFQEAQLQEEKEIMKLSSVIGLTTTGAAKYQTVLQEVKPGIVIVEEAAEVLEAHIITSLSKDCQHLVLIGDHKQLRPNPAVYRLAKNFNLDISLFERMVRNGMAFRTLKHQHRMRPEIANIMRFIYPEIEDHPDVTEYSDIKGVTKNVLFINHNHPERLKEGLKSYYNEYEARYAAKLCYYLLQQGYKKEQITVLTTYTGQLLEIQKCMPKESYGGVKVTVVDNYQGEENVIVILSLVRSNSQIKIGFLKTENRICVALSRAKSGFFVLGNFDHLSAYSELWRKLTFHMKENGLFQNGLSLYCQNHPNDVGITANIISDFNKSPEGGCLKMCTFRLNCGHVCKRHCHILDSSHEMYQCMDSCTFSCEKGHPCLSPCYRKCPSCEIEIPKIVPQCGHTQNVPCYMNPENFVCQVSPCPVILACGHACKQKCGEDHTKNCTENISFTWPCGHIKVIECWQQATLKCPIPCNTVLECGHQCSGSCSSCFSDRFHDSCKHKCGRTLVCGHNCVSFCTNCPPCEQPCENACIHSECKRMCGELCTPCKQKCSWKCIHYQCSRLCSDPCDRPPCDQACHVILPCDHPCIGLCGEPCPDLCRICDKQEVTQILFGEEDDENARFVYLEDCDHIVESKAMDNYMKQKVEDNSIHFKGCPWCNTPIRRCVRYGSIINATLQDIESVKRVLIGDMSEHRGLIRKLQNKLRTKPPQLSLKLNNSESCKKTLLMTQLQRLLSKRLSNILRNPDISGQKVQALTYLFEKCQEIVDLKYSINKSDDLYENNGKHITKYLKDVLQKLLRERFVISKQEVIDIELEIKRAKVLLKYQKIKDAISSFTTEKKSAANRELTIVLGIIRKPERLKNAELEQVKESFEKLKELTKVDGLGIIEEEKLTIIQALKLPKGHWFKCPNSHVYAIGECGGANQKGKCPECNADIGGVSHRLAEGNTLAQEMDSATFAAYSEEANNMMNFDLQNL